LRAGRVTGSDVVLAVWQQVNGRELSDQRKAEFLAHPALDDLTAFSPEILAETGIGLSLARTQGWSCWRPRAGAMIMARNGQIAPRTGHDHETGGCVRAR